jgi:tetratricopeptide (TPR) repeat protein
MVGTERLEDAVEKNASPEQLIAHKKTALNYYHHAISILPDEAFDGLASAHAQIGNTYALLDEIDHALAHYQQAIRHRETTGDFYNAGKVRLNIAAAFLRKKRFVNAREYADTAFQNFEQSGRSGTDFAIRAIRLIDEIKECFSSDENGHQA